MPRPKKPASPFRNFNSLPEIIRLVVMTYVRFPLFAAGARRQRVSRMKGFRQWRWHLDEVYVTRRAA